MPRNKLLSPTPYKHDPRCTGRTTAIALDTISRAIAKQGHYVYAADHVDGLPNALQLQDTILTLVGQMGLKFITATTVRSVGQYNNHVRLCSDIWAGD